MPTSHLRWVQAAPDAPACHERWTLTAAPAVMKQDKPVTAMPEIDLPLEPRERAVFRLTAAAEIERALMVQYLYAAYSLRVPLRDAHAGAGVAQWKRGSRIDSWGVMADSSALDYDGNPSHEEQPYACCGH